MNLPRGLALLWLGLASCTLDTTPPSPDAGAPPPEVRVHVTGDIGGALEPVRGAGGLAREVAAARAAGGLTLDAGDRFFRGYRVPVPHRALARRAAEALADAGRRAGLAAMAVGERDLALGLPALRRLAARAGATLVSANLVHAGSSTAAFAPYHLARIEGSTFGVVGVSPVFGPDDPRREAYVWAGLESRPPGPALAAAARAAKAAGADRVIALVHLDRAAAKALWVDAPEVDLAVIAHDRGRSEASFAQPVPFVALSDRNRAFARLRFGGGGPPSLAVEQLGAEDPADPVTAAAVAAARAAPEPTGPPFVGNRACAAECHAPALRHWKTTGHARAFARLLEERQFRNRDCLPCHTTGFARPGGPSIEQLGRYRGVGCEACHGPAPEHAADPEQRRVGPVPPRVCAQCHRLQAYQRSFELAPRWREVLGEGHGS